MDIKTRGKVLARAEEALKAGIPDVTTGMVPAGLAIGLPMLWDDGDRVSLFLTSFGQDLRLVDDGTLIPELDASGRLPADGAWRGLLAENGLAYDDDECEIILDLPTLDGIAERAMAMGRALMALRQLPPAA